MTDIVRGLVIEYRLETESQVRVRQLIVFDSIVFSRSIKTEAPRRHWKAFDIAKPSEKTLAERMPIVRTWLEEIDRQFTQSGYALTMDPFLIEATAEEYETQILTGNTPRNVILRMERVRTDAGLPDPLEPTGAKAAATV